MFYYPIYIWENKYFYIWDFASLKHFFQKYYSRNSEYLLKEIEDSIKTKQLNTGLYYFKFDGKNIEFIPFRLYYDHEISYSEINIELFLEEDRVLYKVNKKVPIFIILFNILLDMGFQVSQSIVIPESYLKIVDGGLLLRLDKDDKLYNTFIASIEEAFSIIFDKNINYHDKLLIKRII